MVLQCDYLHSEKQFVCLFETESLFSLVFYLVKKYHSVKKKKKKHNVPPDSISKLCYVSSLKI